MKTAIEKAINYLEYRKIIDDLVAQNKTSGENQSEAMLNYTKQNVQRMNRLDKHLKLDAELLLKLENINRKMIWLVLTEAWCGDAAQLIPLFNKMAESSQNIELKQIWRDENPEIMNQYLTDGSKSIPKLICLDAETLDEIGTWGPRPKPAQEMVLENKIIKEPYESFSKKLHLWYGRDRTKTTQAEWLEVLDNWKFSV